MSEQTSNPTSGQNVPKSKFRRKSRQEQTAASKLRMERRGEKLDAAREKLAKQKPPKKPGAVKRLAHTAGHGVHGFVHGNNLVDSAKFGCVCGALTVACADTVCADLSCERVSTAVEEVYGK